jgi:hypothetical protein
MPIWLQNILNGLAETPTIVETFFKEHSNSFTGLGSIATAGAVIVALRLSRRETERQIKAVRSDKLEKAYSQLVALGELNMQRYNCTSTAEFDEILRAFFSGLNHLQMLSNLYFWHLDRYRVAIRELNGRLATDAMTRASGRMSPFATETALSLGTVLDQARNSLITHETEYVSKGKAWAAKEIPVGLEQFLPRPNA